jgi:hypothetical protein
MANANPSPATGFGPGNPGSGRAKQKGARDRMSAAFLTALADDFDEHGAAVIARVRDKDPSTYMRVYASLMPKEVDLGTKGALDDIPTEVLRAYWEQRLAERANEAEDAKEIQGTTVAISEATAVK